MNHARMHLELRKLFMLIFNVDRVKPAVPVNVREPEHVVALLLNQ